MNEYTLKQQGEAQHGTESYRLCFCCCWFVCRNMVLIYFKRRTQNKRKFGTTVFKLTSVKMLTKNVFKISLCLKVLFATLAVTVKKKKHVAGHWTGDRCRLGEPLFWLNSTVTSSSPPLRLQLCSFTVSNLKFTVFFFREVWVVVSIWIYTFKIWFSSK